MQTKWRILWLLSIAELLAMTLWFSASAVVPQLTTEYALTPTEQSLLTMSVQFGFVIGALVIALLNLADRYQAHCLIAICTLLGALFNASIALFEVSISSILVLRFLTGAMLAGVYPPAMTVLASWFTAGRGLAMWVHRESARSKWNAARCGFGVARKRSISATGSVFSTSRFSAQPRRAFPTP